MQIESPFIKVDIAKKGASIKSIFDKERGFEYLSAAGSKNFFPFVGRCIDDKYRIESKFYSMERNGIIKDEEFSVTKQEDDRLRLSFESNSGTLKVYPYEFLLKIDYLVYGPILKIVWTIENTSKVDMYFSMGTQFPLSLPAKGEKLDDYYWSFDSEESIGAYYFQEGLINFEYKDDRTIFVKGNIPLSKDTFRNGPLVFRDPISEKIKLDNKYHKSEIEFSFGNCRFLSLLEIDDKIGIELCQGVSDYIFSDFDLLKKEGIIQLEPFGIYQEVMEIKFK